MILLFLLVLLHGSVSAKCPTYWINAHDHDMGCLLFNMTSYMGPNQAQEICKGSEPLAHLVEIFKEDQHMFITEKCLEYEFITGTKRRWWIGLVDELSEGNWYWPFSLQVADYTAWAEAQEMPDLILLQMLPSAGR